MKRAKEKARLRKSQQKEAAVGGSGVNGLLCGTNPGSHCGPLLSLPQDCMSSLASSQTQADIDVEAYSNPIDVLNNSREQQQRQPNGTLTNGSLTRDSTSSHGSMQRQQRQAAAAAQSLGRGDDDIYTLPVDSCRPSNAQGGGGNRPISLHMAAETVQQQQQHNSMTR